MRPYELSDEAVGLLAKESWDRGSGKKHVTGSGKSLALAELLKTL